MESQRGIVFIHGRPAPHPFHGALASSVDADFLPVDFLLRWHDRNSTRARRYLSWLLCSLFFPQRRRYRIFLTEGPHFLPIVMRRLGLLAKDQRAATILDNETLYFLREERYRKTTRLALRRSLLGYDALMCIGRVQTELARELLDGSQQKPQVIQLRSGLPARSKANLNNLSPRLDSQQIVFIGNGPSGWRAWYKGIDLLFAAFKAAAAQVEGLRLTIVGEWERSCANALMNGSSALAGRVQFLGHQADLTAPLSDSALYVRLGRGEAFGISVLEAMCAGVPAIVSEWTGAREAVEQVDPRLVVPLDSKTAAERICWYMKLPLEQKLQLSARSRDVAAAYSEERACSEFRAAVNQLL